MISLGNICRNIMFRDEATAVLAAHATYTWNKARTRIRCNGDSCGVILEAPDGPDGLTAAPAFALHQAGLLPDPFDIRAEPDAPAEPAIPEAGTVPAESAGEHMETTAAEPVDLSAPAAPAKTRRDTKALTATIEEIKKGDRVSAVLNHPRYGQFTVEGTVLQGGAGQDRDQLLVGGWYLNIGARAAKHLQELTILAPAGQHGFEIPKPSAATEHVGIGG